MEHPPIPERQIKYWPAEINCAYISRKINTSVTILSTPSMRLDVPKRPGFADTADKTFWTKVKSWIGSAQRGPPSCRRKEAVFITSTLTKTCFTTSALTWCLCPQCSHSGPTGGPVAAEYFILKLHQRILNILSDTSKDWFLLLFSIAGSSAHPLQVKRATAGTVVNQSLFTGGNERSGVKPSDCEDLSSSPDTDRSPIVCTWLSSSPWLGRWRLAQTP